MDYRCLYPWAKSDVLCEILCLLLTSAFEIFVMPKHSAKLALRKILLLSLISLRNLYVEIVCMNPLSIFYETLFTRIGLQLPLNPFEKEILNTMNVVPS